MTILCVLTNDLKSKCLFIIILTDKGVKQREYVPFNSGWFYLNIVEVWLP